MANFNFNEVILGGRLTDTPELKATNGDVEFTDFTVAVNRPPINGRSDTDFIRCIAWRKTAEFIVRYFKKGSSICVTGAIRTRTWTDKHDQKQFTTEVVVSNATFVDSKNDAAPEEKEVPKYNAENAPKFEDIDPEDEDLPF